MATTAVAHINGAADRRIRIMLYQRFGQPNIIGVDIEDMGLRIERGPSPLSAAVEARPHQSILSHAHGNELSIASYFRKALDSPRVGLGSSIGEHVFRNPLAREGRRLDGEGLLLRRHLARDVAG